MGAASAISSLVFAWILEPDDLWYVTPNTATTMATKNNNAATVMATKN